VTAARRRAGAVRVNDIGDDERRAVRSWGCPATCEAAPFAVFRRDHPDQPHKPLLPRAFPDMRSTSAKFFSMRRCIAVRGRLFRFRIGILVANAKTRIGIGGIKFAKIRPMHRGKVRSSIPSGSTTQLLDFTDFSVYVNVPHISGT
jgi:hypothetical protein